MCERSHFASLISSLNMESSDSEADKAFHGKVFDLLRCVHEISFNNESDIVDLIQRYIDNVVNVHKRRTACLDKIVFLLKNIGGEIDGIPKIIQSMQAVLLQLRDTFPLQLGSLNQSLDMVTAIPTKTIDTWYNLDRVCSVISILSDNLYGCQWTTCHYRTLVKENKLATGKLMAARIVAYAQVETSMNESIELENGSIWPGVLTNIVKELGEDLPIVGEIGPGKLLTALMEDEEADVVKLTDIARLLDASLNRQLDRFNEHQRELSDILPMIESNITSITNLEYILTILDAIQSRGVGWEDESMYMEIHKDSYDDVDTILDRVILEQNYQLPLRNRVLWKAKIVNRKMWRASNHPSRNRPVFDSVDLEKLIKQAIDDVKNDGEWRHWSTENAL